MSSCCPVAEDQARRLAEAEPITCPDCGNKGKPVPTLTVKSLVRDHLRVYAKASYWFCKTPPCDVVYFGLDTAFRKPDLKVRVGIKEREDPIPLCYCFGYTRADVRREIETLGSTDIPDRIKAEIQAGFCACEVKNPSGACCLGEVTRAIKEAQILNRPNGNLASGWGSGL